MPKWITIKKAEEKLNSIPREKDIQLIMLMLNDKGEYILETYCKWSGYIQGWFDQPLSEFQFKEFIPKKYKRVMFLDGIETINKGVQNNGWPDLENIPFKL